MFEKTKVSKVWETLVHVLEFVHETVFYWTFETFAFTRIGKKRKMTERTRMNISYHIKNRKLSLKNKHAMSLKSLKSPLNFIRNRVLYSCLHYYNVEFSFFSSLYFYLHFSKFSFFWKVSIIFFFGKVLAARKYNFCCSFCLSKIFSFC